MFLYLWSLLYCIFRQQSQWQSEAIYMSALTDSTLFIWRYQTWIIFKQDTTNVLTTALLT